jgi:hypothetical protein
MTVLIFLMYNSIQTFYLYVNKNEYSYTFVDNMLNFIYNFKFKQLSTLVDNKNSFSKLINVKHNKQIFSNILPAVGLLEVRYLGGVIISLLIYLKDLMTITILYIL